MKKTGVLGSRLSMSLEDRQCAGTTNTDKRTLILKTFTDLVVVMDGPVSER